MNYERQQDLSFARSALLSAGLKFMASHLDSPVKMNIAERDEFDAKAKALVELLNTPERCGACNQEIHNVECPA